MACVRARCGEKLEMDKCKSAFSWAGLFFFSLLSSRYGSRASGDDVESRVTPAMAFDDANATRNRRENCTHSV